MTKSIIVDATHTEETRTAVVEDGRVIDFDYESSIRQQLKGSIFLAKVTRVEPSLQAAFVNFGGERHGFLPFNEIHPDYFKIPVADREAIIAEQKAYVEALAKQEEEEDTEQEEGANTDTEEAIAPEEVETLEEGEKTITPEDDAEDDSDDNNQETSEESTEESTEGSSDKDDKKKQSRGRGRGKGRGKGRRSNADARKVEIVGGDVIDDDYTPRPTLRKNYKIQEVVKRSQIMLVQAQKEERGNKGAAVTTYISLPGRYCVLMPNSPRGGGVSRKVANYKERKRMRDILKELNVPEGMSVILRTAGVSRNKTEIKRDLDYLMRLWDDIRALTLESIAPSCVYEEGSLIKRCIRDIYTRDVEEVVIAGEKTFKEAKKFMKMLIPSHTKKVVEYKDDVTPLFHKYKVETQLTEMGTPEAHMKSGGSIVINPTEALVAIDVNSGRATKERHIEETALRTNLEAAEEVARQLKLRDLGGLIVIDFIDMENYRNNAKVERRLKECLSSDRARIQIGRISSFGLLEMSRQRLNPSMTEAQFKLCESCQGLGYTRTTDSTAIIALRTIEAYAIDNNDKKEDITLTVNNKVALFILNNKRELLSSIEEKHGCKIALKVDDSLAPASFLINDKAPIAEKPQVKNDHKSKRGRNNRNKQRNNNNNNRNHQDHKQHDQKKEDAVKSDDQPKDVKKPEAESEKPTEDQPKKRRGRKPKTKDSAEESSDVKTKEPSEAPAANDDKKDDKPAKKTRKPRAKKAEKPDTTKEEKPASKNAEVKVVTAAATEDKAPAASVDKDYEKVNEAPKKKKKGWWSKG